MGHGVDGARLWDSLMEMARIGATANGGSNRQALTPEDFEGRELFASWCRDAGCTMETDALGNMFARRAGSDDSLAPLVIGSHLDTQPTGGRFDGVLGVLAALEVVRTFADRGLDHARPLEVVNWTNEEGARFGPALMGSGVFAGEYGLDEALDAKDLDGTTVREELLRHGLGKGRHPSEKGIHAYLELHIEQGPVLERAGKQVGVVTGVQGCRWYVIDVHGLEAHAGTTPASVRKDPTLPAADIVSAVGRIARMEPDARATVGRLHAYPGSPNVVPGRVNLTVDMRHPSDERLSEMDAMLRAAVDKARSEHPCAIEAKELWHAPMVGFDAAMVDAVRGAAGRLGLEWIEMTSGAGHDAVFVARKAPAGMVFVPCRDGISHNEQEHIEPEQAADGANTLLEAALNLLEAG